MKMDLWYESYIDLTQPQHNAALRSLINALMKSVNRWTVVISYPRSASPAKAHFEGSRDEAIAVARARIDGWLKRQQPTPR